MIAPYDIDVLRAEFPVLDRTVHGGMPLVYLDNAATKQRPQVVIDAMTQYASTMHSNIHRSGHQLASEATSKFELTRQLVTKLIGARSSDEIIFTKGTTESVNLVATAWGNANLQRGETVLLTEMEHHGNIVPWQFLQSLGVKLQALGVKDDGTLDMEHAEELLSKRPKMFAFTHVSNVLGTINDVKALCALARKYDVLTFIDGAQAVAHVPVDVQDIGCDFYAFSAHKLYGPTGVGVLFGKRELLDAMPPYQGGGSMIASVSFEKTTFNDIPYRFEAGTPNIEGVIGLGAAIKWFTQLDMDMLHQHDAELLALATSGLESIDGLHVIGTAPNKIGIVSFTVDGMHANDIGMLCDEQGVALRTGHHCTMPLHKRFGVAATARASFAAFTTTEEVEMLVNAVKKSVKMLR